MAVVEQIGGGNHGACRKSRKHAKKRAKRYWRRLAKKLMQDAPRKRFYTGYFW